MIISNKINQNRANFEAICKNHNVKTMFAFGSSITDKFDEKTSDIDLLVDVNYDDPIEKGNSLIDLWDGLETFFNLKVDLLTTSSLKNPYLKNNIERTKLLIYDGERSQVLI